MNTRIIPEFGNEPAEVLEIKPFKHIEKLIIMSCRTPRDE